MTAVLDRVDEEFVAVDSPEELWPIAKIFGGGVDTLPMIRGSNLIYFGSDERGLYYLVHPFPGWIREVDKSILVTRFYFNGELMFNQSDMTIGGAKPYLIPQHPSIKLFAHS